MSRKPTSSHAKPAAAPAWRAYLAVFIGILAITAHTASSYSLSILMKSMLAEFRWDRTTFASAMTGRMFLMVLMLSFAGQLTDRYGTRIVLAVGAAVVGIGTFGISQAETLWQFYPLMALMGPGQACIGPVAASALVLRMFEQRRGLAVGLLNGGDNLISAGIPIAAAYFLRTSGWRTALVVLAGAYLVLAALIALVLKPNEGRSEAAHQEKTSKRTGVRLRDLPWSDWRLWTLCLSYAAIYAFITSVQLHMHAYLTDLGRTAEQASEVMSLMILTGAAGAPAFGWLAERIGARLALVILVAGLLVNSVVIWNATEHGTFLVWAVTYGLINSGVVALLALVLHEIFGGEKIGRLMGVAMVFCMGSTMLANLYSASTFDHAGSYIDVWRTYTAMMVGALPLVGALAWRGR